MSTPEERKANKALDEKIQNMSQQSPFLVQPVIMGDLSLASPSTQTTVGAAGSADALPANPTGYILVNIGNGSFILPYYARS